MKRISMFLSLLLMPVFAFAGMSNYPNGVAVANQTQEATATVATGAGDVYVADALEVAGQVIATAGLINVKQEFIAPDASSATAYKGVLISTATLKAGATVMALANGDYTMQEVSRNVTVLISSVSTVTGSLAIAGTNARGVSASETLTITSTQTVTGAVAWSKITAFTLTTTAMAKGSMAGSSAYISIGTGVKLGLVNDISAYTDVYKIAETRVDTTPSGTYINATYDTYTPQDVPDGTSNYEIHYKSTGK